MQAFSGAPELD